MESKQMYTSGLRVYLLDNYNCIDFVVLSLYLSSYVLRFLVDHWIKDADRFYNGTACAREVLLRRNYSMYDSIQNQIFNDRIHVDKSYFMKACKPRSHEHLLPSVVTITFCSLRIYNARLQF